MNQSKIDSPVQWNKWRKAGALAGMPEAKMNQVLQNPIQVDATGTSHVDGVGVRQTLSLGLTKVSEFVYKPVIAVVVPGDRFRPGDMVSRANLPKSTKPMERVYPE